MSTVPDVRLPVSGAQARIEHLEPGPLTVPVAARVSCFRGPGGTGEYHLVLSPRQPAPVAEQAQWLARACGETLAGLGCDAGGVLWRRLFCSDIARQAAVLAACPLAAPGAPSGPCAASLVEQPPHPPARLALWAYHVRLPEAAPDKTLAGPTLAWRHGGLAHLWTAGLSCPRAGGAHAQTRALLGRYEALLRSRGLSLADSLLRIWLFVRDIDRNYAPMVAARRAFFHQRGLTPATHYVASTGIEGRGVEPAALVTFDAYAVGGLRPGQVSYLAAPEYLSPTHVYGVTFERGVAISYRDRRHVFISGTASIDRHGQTLHRGDLERQLQRTLVNVAALLERAGAGFADVAVMLAYVRDPAHRLLVEQRLRRRLGRVPALVLAAPVCRPGWLVELECHAIVAARNPGLPAF